MLTEVSGQPACQIVTCVGTPKPWVDDTWTASTPQGCDDDRVMGLASDDLELYLNHELVEISAPGDYEFSTSAGAASITACGDSCSVGYLDFAYIQVVEGAAAEVSLGPGIYRVETQSSGSGSDGEVRLQAL